MGAFFFAGKALEKILKPLEMILEKVIQATVEPVLKIIIKFISKSFQFLLQNLLEPFINFLANSSAYLIEHILIPLGQIMITLAQPLLNIILMITFKIISLIVGNLLAGIVNLAILPADFLEKNDFLVKVSTGMQVFAIALLGLFATYYAFKSIFLYMGFESEEPWKIMIRVGVGAILVYGSMDICIYMFKLNYFLQNALFTSFGMGESVKFDSKIFGESLSEGMFNNLDLVSQLLDVVVFLTITIKLLMLAIKFMERQVILMLYVIISPIALACSVAKPLRTYTSGYLKSFAGNFIIQTIQLIGVLLITVIAKSNAYSTPGIAGGGILKSLMILGCISVMLKANEIALAIGDSRFGTDLGGGGFEAAKYYATNAVSKVSGSAQQMKGLISTFKGGSK